MTLGPKVVPFVAVFSCLSCGPALAQTCGVAIDQLARQHNLALEAPGTGSAGQLALQAAPPATIESRGLTETQPPAGSTGAFTPPPAGVPPATSPPIGSGSSLPPPGAQRLPPPGVQQLNPPQSTVPGSGAINSDLNAADRGRMEALLKAARDADRRGDGQHCLELVREAEAGPGVSGTGRPQ